MLFARNYPGTISQFKADKEQSSPKDCGLFQNNLKSSGSAVELTRTADRTLSTGTVWDSGWYWISDPDTTPIYNTAVTTLRCPM